MKKSCDELRRCSRDTQLKFVFVFVRVSSVSPAEPLLELSSQPVALKYYYSTTVLLPYYGTTVLLPYSYGTTVLLLYYCTLPGVRLGRLWRGV